MFCDSNFSRTKGYFRVSKILSSQSLIIKHWLLDSNSQIQLRSLGLDDQNWQYFKSLFGTIVEHLFSIRHLLTYFGKLNAIGQIFILINGQIFKQYKCDPIWQNIVTLAKLWKSLAIFAHLFSIWA